MAVRRVAAVLAARGALIELVETAPPTAVAWLVWLVTTLATAALAWALGSSDLLVWGIAGVLLVLAVLVLRA